MENFNCKKELLLMVFVFVFSLLTSCESTEENNSTSISAAAATVVSTDSPNVSAIIDILNLKYGSIQPALVTKAELKQIQDWLATSNYLSLSDSYNNYVDGRVRAYIFSEINGRSILFAEVPYEIQSELISGDLLIVSKNESDDTEEDTEKFTCPMNFCFNGCCQEGITDCPAPPPSDQCQSGSDCDEKECKENSKDLFDF